jgi:hypothetical protein
MLVHAVCPGIASRARSYRTAISSRRCGSQRKEGELGCICSTHKVTEKRNNGFRFLLWDRILCEFEFIHVRKFVLNDAMSSEKYPSHKMRAHCTNTACVTLTGLN